MDEEPRLRGSDPCPWSLSSEVGPDSLTPKLCLCPAWLCLPQPHTKKTDRRAPSKPIRRLPALDDSKQFAGPGFSGAGGKDRAVTGPAKVIASSPELEKSAVILLELVTIVRVFIPSS